MRCSKSFNLFWCSVCFILLSSTVLAAPRKGPGEACLKANERLLKYCGNFSDVNMEESIVDVRSAKRCQQARKKESSVCALLRLRCNKYDPLVCGTMNLGFFGGVASPPVPPALKTFNNICEFKKAASEGYDFKARGACPAKEPPVVPTVTSTAIPECSDSRAVCGRRNIQCLIAPCPESDPQWFRNVCELQKAGAIEVSSNLCIKDTQQDKGGIYAFFFLDPSCPVIRIDFFCLAVPFIGKVDLLSFGDRDATGTVLGTYDTDKTGHLLIEGLYATVPNQGGYLLRAYPSFRKYPTVDTWVNVEAGKINKVEIAVPSGIR